MVEKDAAETILEKYYPLTKTGGRPLIRARICLDIATRLAESGDFEASCKVFCTSIDVLNLNAKVAVNSLNRFFRTLCFDENGLAWRQGALPYGVKLMQHPIIEEALDASPLGYVKSKNNLAIALLEIAEKSDAEERRTNIETAISILEDALMVARASKLEEQVHLVANLKAAREKR